MTPTFALQQSGSSRPSFPGLGALVLVLVLVLVAACGEGGDGARCERDEQCASGFCRADGTCAPEGADAGAGVDADPAQPDGATGACAPDNDRIVSRDEVPLEAGRSARFRVALDATIDSAGTMMVDGTRRWALGQTLAGDADVDLTLLAPAGQWWAPEFPAATYAAPLSAESDLLGVFEVSATQVRLLGVVSPSAGLTRTELSYDPPVPVLQLPLTTTSRWMVSSTVSGLATGVLSVYSEDYTFAVDAVGALTTPYGEFPVLRVASDLERTVGVLTTPRRSFAFVAECFGTVATVVSQDFEDGREFTDAAEVRRLAP